MDLVEAATAESQCDLMASHAGHEQLVPSNYAVLACRKIRDYAICPSSE